MQSNIVVAVALLAATPFFLVFGGLSDRIGRKPIMLLGMLLGILTYRPIYSAMYGLTDVSQKEEVSDARRIQRKLTKQPNGDPVTTTTTTHFYLDGTTLSETTAPAYRKQTGLAEAAASAKLEVTKAVTMPTSNLILMILLVFVQVLYVTMVYGPIAAFLVELFPTRIRYTSMSLPYHIGNGIFGGLTPFIATALVATANKANEASPGSVEKPYLEGLWYPIIVAGVCFVIGLLYLNNQRQAATEE